MSYRIAWAGPWHERSAIAAFGSDILAVLAGAGHRVEVFRTETGTSAELPPLPAPGPVHPAGVLTHDLVAGHHDAVFVNFGDNFPYHGAALSLLEPLPAIAILHDADMTNFGNGWRAQDPAAPIALGSMVEFVAARSIAAVVHAQHYRPAVEEACLGPVVAMPLGHSFSTICDDLPPPPATGPFVVATIGHVNSNKRADQVIRAIGASPRLRERARYMLIGPVEDERREFLTALARRVGAPKPEFTGRVSDAELRARLAGVSAICCLRDPVIEGGSGSLILGLLSGRPTLVSNQASYAEVPDGLVMKCPPGAEAAHVVYHLETLLEDRVAGRAMGEQAKAYAARTFAPTSYAAGLLALAERAARSAPATLAQRRIGGTLYSLGLPCDRKSIQAAARELSSLLGGRDRELDDGVGAGENIGSRAGTG